MADLVPTHASAADAARYVHRLLRREIVLHAAGIHPKVMTLDEASDAMWRALREAGTDGWATGHSHVTGSLDGTSVVGVSYWLMDETRRRFEFDLTPFVAKLDEILAAFARGWLYDGAIGGGVAFYGGVAHRIRYEDVATGRVLMQRPHGMWGVRDPGMPMRVELGTSDLDEAITRVGWTAAEWTAWRAAQPSTATS